jgi:hypothetical protein
MGFKCTGQDPHVYGTLNVTNVKEACKENHGCDDSVDNPVNKNITCLPSEQGNIYQQLNQDGQQYSNEYQALNHPDKTIMYERVD